MTMSTLKRPRVPGQAVATAAFVALALGCDLPGLHADSCRHEAERNVTVAADGVERVRIASGGGKLEVRGQPDLNEVRVRGRACASSPVELERVRLEAERSGSSIVVRTELPGRGRHSLDLQIDVPAAVALDIRHGAGEVITRDTGPLRITDGSGDVDIEGVAGNLDIRDGSGQFGIRLVTGEVRGKDGSGDLSIREINGSVRVQDGSGAIEVIQVGGNVTVLDGSGDIVVQQVEGDFSVKRDGSGAVNHEGVLGQVSIGER